MLPRAQIHLENIAENWRTLDKLHPGATTAAVVKADAYGLGAVRVAKALRDAGCDTFFVAYLREGIGLRRILGRGPRIFVLNGLVERDVPHFLGAGLTPVISDEYQLEAWARAPKGTCALHFDTGMNRLGLNPRLLMTSAASLRQLEPVLVMSHLACADDRLSQMNDLQLQDFVDIAGYFPDTPASLANSAGTFLGRAYAMDLIRPGIALYGGGPRPPEVELRTAITLTASVISVFDAKAGRSVGYGATHILERDARLATVSLGYADGILRSGSNSLVGYIGDECFPVVGRVSMDLMTIDVTKAQGVVKAGMRVEFLGPHAKLDEQAARAGTLSYELLTGLGRRVQRIYA